MTLRGSVIVRKLEVLPKLARFLLSFQRRPLTSQKKPETQQEKSENGAIYGMSHTLCCKPPCFQLSNAIKALACDCRSLYCLLLFSHCHPSLSDFDWNNFLRDASVPHGSLQRASPRCSQAAPCWRVQTSGVVRGIREREREERLRDAFLKKLLYSRPCDWLWSRLPVTGTVEGTDEAKPPRRPRLNKVLVPSWLPRDPSPEKQPAWEHFDM